MVSKGDLIVLTYPNRQYAVFVKRVDVEKQIVVCCEQLTPQYIQEVFIPLDSLKKSSVKVLSRFDLTN